jgi:hypothetical protein
MYVFLTYGFFGQCPFYLVNSGLGHKNPTLNPQFLPFKPGTYNTGFSSDFGLAYGLGLVSSQILVWY